MIHKQREAERVHGPSLESAMTQTMPSHNCPLTIASYIKYAANLEIIRRTQVCNRIVAFSFNETPKTPQPEVLTVQKSLYETKAMQFEVHGCILRGLTTPNPKPAEAIELRETTPFEILHHVQCCIVH